MPEYDWHMRARTTFAKAVPAAYPGGPSQEVGAPVILIASGKAEAREWFFASPSQEALAINIAWQAATEAMRLRGELTFHSRSIVRRRPTRLRTTRWDRSMTSPRTAMQRSSLATKRSKPLRIRGWPRRSRPRRGPRSSMSPSSGMSAALRLGPSPSHPPFAPRHSSCFPRRMANRMAG
jgi:hypothetical protein